MTLRIKYFPRKRIFLSEEEGKGQMKKKIFRGFLTSMWRDEASENVSHFFYQVFRFFVV